jgi:hypothetical protein
MKQHRMIRNVLFVAVIAILVLACAGQAVAEATATAAATRTPAATSTPLPTNTATPRPTSTPDPTATLEPTPAPVGVAAANEDFEVTVVKVRKLQTVYLDKIYQWIANPGYLFLELGVKVRNLKAGSTVSVPWANIYVEDKDGAWYPGWGAFKAVASGTEISPTSLIFAQIKNEREQVVFDEDVYLRLIWTIADQNPSIVLFGFDNSPMIEVTID